MTPRLHKIYSSAAIALVSFALVSFVLPGLSQAQVFSMKNDQPYLERVTKLFEIVSKQPQTLNDILPHFDHRVGVEMTERSARVDPDNRFHTWIDLGQGIKQLSITIPWEESPARWDIHFYRDTIYYHCVKLYDPDVSNRKLIEAARTFSLSLDILDRGEIQLRKLNPERGAIVRAMLDKAYGVAPIASIETEYSDVFERAMYGGGKLWAGTFAGWAGTPLELYELVSSLKADGNIDALVSLMHGVSPAGRAMAAVTLTQMAKEGHELPSAVTQTIVKLRGSKDPVTFAQGCLVSELTLGGVIETMTQDD